MPRNVSRKHRTLLKGNDPEGRQEIEAGEATPPSTAVAPMGKRLSMRPPPWDKSAAEAEPGSFGHWLRRQRELREISLRDIAERTKISLRYLEAMEDDRFDLLPAPVFAKGFLREYARYVGLSPDEVVNHWLSVQPAVEGERPTDPSPAAGRSFRGEHPRADPSGRGVHSAQSGHSAAPAGRSWVSRALVLLGILIALVFVAGAVYYTVQHRGGRKPRARPAVGALPAVAPSPAPALRAAPPSAGPEARPAAALPSPMADGPTAGIQHAALGPAAGPAALDAAAASPAGEPGEPSPLEVTLDFSRDCWVEAVIDGKKWISEERVPGEALQLQAQESVVLTLGNPGAVEAQVNGYSYGLPPGRQTVHGVVIDLDTVRALKDKHEAL